jgi:hypothetical protein
MTLRPEYALGNSVYNDFLFAAVGEERVGQPLTVLSALARLGFDPWIEAARLANLPSETAARAFAVTIAMLPEGDWKVADSDEIAKRLVGWLPKRGEPTPAVPAARATPGLPGAIAGLFNAPPRQWLLWGALAVAVVLFSLMLRSETFF